MIHHLSVAAKNPKTVAAFFAELTGGVVVDFPPNPGGYMTFAPDDHGTAIEVYPSGSVMLPNGADGAIFARQPSAPGDRSPTHVAISVALDAAAVAAMARARGWACQTCDRGGDFHVIEVWVENAWLVEVLPSAFADEYLDFAKRVVKAAQPARALDAHQPQLATLERV